jgi:oligopeptidase B
MIIIIQLLQAINPPIAKKLPQNIKIHNQVRNDDYYWMNQKDDDWVLDYLKSENNYRDEILKHTNELQSILQNEMTSRISEEETSVSYIENGYNYRKVFLKDNDYEIYQRCRIGKEKNSVWETILDVNQLAIDYDYADIGWIQPSPNNQYLAFGLDSKGNYRFNIKIINLITGQILNENIPNTWGKCVWHPNNNRIYYSEKDNTNRNLFIKEHWIGFNKNEDKIIFEEKDLKFSVYISMSSSNQFMFIGSESTNATEFSYIDIEDKKLKIQLLFPREENHLYYPMEYNGSFYLLTNKDNIEFEIKKLSINSNRTLNLETILTPEKNQTFENFIILENHLVILERTGVKPSFLIHNLSSDSTFQLSFDEKLYYIDFKDNLDSHAYHFRFEYSSPVTPEIIYDYNLRTNALIPRHKRQIPGDFNSKNYTIEQKLVIDKTGNIEIPLTIIYHNDFYNQNGQNPFLLYGYGSYGSITDSYFVNSYISLLDRGVAIAIAHIRGSGDLGKQWYNEGKMLQKMNTFTDFIDCAKFLIDNEYTTSERLFASGMSAGGLLVGAVSNLAPELFKGIIAEVPFVDVLTTMSDASIPLTTQEYQEWGNPEVRQYFDYMKQYSPYDNIKEMNYPAMFVTASYNDSQVGYWEPAKWVAKLREYKTDNNPLLLSTDMTGSHSGPSGRFSGYQLIALEYAFLLDQVGFLNLDNP